MHWLLWLISAFFGSPNGYLHHFEAQPRSGDGINSFLARYELSDASCNFDEFYALNRIEKSHRLQLHRRYRLPILIYRYNGTSIRSTLGDSDYQKALRIQKYNENILRKGLRGTHYRESQLLWVPYHELACEPSDVSAERHKEVLGTDYKFELKGKSLRNRVFFLVAGHGGPDPGAVGACEGKQICEDEYAYDVVLRLYRYIIENGGIAELIIHDPIDRIRDGRLLRCDHDERCGDEEIPLNQLERLRQRVDRINTLYKHYRAKGLRDQTCLSIHIDSRTRTQRQDVFFCHYGLSRGSHSLARRLQQTFATKYRKHRAGGQYHGTVESRNLFVLKNTIPKAVLVELANIKNVNDHQRILLSSNREALARWIFEGLGGTP